MAAITIRTGVANAGVAAQLLVEDWERYVVQSTWTFSIFATSVGGLTTFVSRTTDPVDVTDRQYPIFDWKADFVPMPGYLLSLPGMRMLTSKLLLLTYGARVTKTSFGVDLFTPFHTMVKGAIAGAWGYASVSNAMSGLPVNYEGNHSLGVVGRGNNGAAFQGVCVVRPSGVPTVVLDGRFPMGSMEIGVPSTQGGITQEIGERIAAALEEIVMSRIDVTLNHGGQVYSATTQTAP